MKHSKYKKILQFKMYRDLLQSIEEKISHKLLKNQVNKILKKTPEKFNRIFCSFYRSWYQV